MKQGLRKVIVLVGLMLTLLTGCVFQDEVETNEMSVLLYKNEIQQVKGPGVYTELGCFYCDLKTVNVDTLTFSVEDPEVLTKDNQAVSVKITLQARRKSDDESIENLFTKWSSLTEDDLLTNTISATAREGMKVGTRKFTLTQLLDERSGGTETATGTTAGLAEEIRKAIEEDASKYGVELINVTVENIGASPEYMAILGQTANLNAEIDKAKREQELIRQQAANDVLQQEQRIAVAQQKLIAEQAETNVQLEIAEREGEVIAARNAIYIENAQAFELRRLELLKGVLGDKTMFLPSDAILTLIQGAGGILPLNVTPGVAPVEDPGR
jgi:hypothetical protein